MQQQVAGCHYEGLVQLSALELARHRDALLAGAMGRCAPDTLDKLCRLCVVAAAGLGDIPHVAAKLRIAEAEMQAAEIALARKQALLASDALRRSLVWLKAALAEPVDR